MRYLPREIRCIIMPIKPSSSQKSKNYCKICGKEIDKQATHCVQCSYLLSRKVERPNREELKKLIRTEPFTTIAKRYGVSDNAIRKWAIVENLPYKKTEIKKYSDEEWESI